MIADWLGEIGRLAGAPSTLQFEIIYCELVAIQSVLLRNEGPVLPEYEQVHETYRQLLHDYPFYFTYQ